MSFPLLEAALAYLNREVSYKVIADRYGVEQTRIKVWVRQYKEGGALAFKEQQHNTTFEERITIVKDCLENGSNYGETAIKYNVSYQQVYTWIHKFSQLGEAGLEDRRGRRTQNQEARSELEELKIKMAKLEHELYMTKMERDLLKKLEELERGDAYRK